MKWIPASNCFSLIKGRQGAGVLFIFSLLVVACGVWVNRPFPDLIYEKHRSLEGLSRAQRANVIRAFQSIDQKVILPHREFSMDRTLGPRQVSRGYQSAPAYFERMVEQASIGGGICVVSSMVYEAALSLGFPVIERKAHTRPVRSVPLGLDATLWENKVDLKFKNPWDQPLQLRTTTNPEGVTLQVWSRPLSPALAKSLPLQIHRQVRRYPHMTEVVVYRSTPSGEGIKRISRDWYRH